MALCLHHPPPPRILQQVLLARNSRGCDCHVHLRTALERLLPLVDLVARARHSSCYELAASKGDHPRRILLLPS
ncbi:hypothetical protein LINPERPRIM_LOCUS25346, partial [Linum perenne]